MAKDVPQSAIVSANIAPITTPPALARNRLRKNTVVRHGLAKLASDYGAIHMKTQDIFDAAAKQKSAEHWIWDGIHPLPQGHELIARHSIERLRVTK